VNEAEPARPVSPPSVHVRVVVTWLAIFPLVALALNVIAAFAPEWPPILRAFVLTAIIVPLAVYLIVPRLLGLYVRLRASRRR
jgi:antibiotic biosynthesis monooxygenase (ABM) superfamily enzyme